MLDHWFLSPRWAHNGPRFDGERMDGLSYEIISVIENCVTTVTRQLNFPNCSERAKAFRSRSACCQRLLAYQELLAAFGYESLGSPAPGCTLTTSRSRARRAPSYGGHSAQRALTAEFPRTLTIMLANDLAHCSEPQATGIET